MMSHQEHNPTHKALFSGAPLNSVLVRLGLGESSKAFLNRRVFFFLGLTWLPLAIIALIEGQFYAPGPKLSFVQDAAVHARFLIAGPLLLLSERIIEPRLLQLVTYLKKSHLVPEAEQVRLQDSLDRVIKSSRSRGAELVLLAISFAGAVAVVIEPPVDTDSWYFGIGASGSEHIMIAGWWYGLLAAPLFRFLLLRWFRFFWIWGRFLREVSRLNLTIAPTHPDRAGGLGLLSGSQSSFSIMFIALGVVLSGTLANAILHDGMVFSTARNIALTYVVVAEIVLLVPLLFFAPAIYRARWNGLIEYGALGDRLVTKFHERWVQSPDPDNVLLDSIAPSAVADYEVAFETVRNMSIVPFRVRDLVRTLIAFIVPFVPLVLTELSLSDFVKMLASFLL